MNQSSMTKPGWKQISFTSRFVMTVMCFTKYGFDTREAYSRIGRTKSSRFYCHRIFARTQNSPY